METLKRYLYNRNIRQRLSREQLAQDIHVQDMKLIGIVFDGTEIDIREKVMGFVEHLKSENYQVKLIGFINQKLESISFPFDYFSLKDVGFNYVPHNAHVKHFLSRPYDLLINLDLFGHLPVHYIAAAAQAKLKVGAPSEEHPYYDLMIEVNAKDDLGAFILEMRNTLNKIA